MFPLVYEEMNTNQEIFPNIYEDRIAENGYDVKGYLKKSQGFNVVVVVVSCPFPLPFLLLPSGPFKK